MMDRCYLFWTYELPGGSCAQWYSASATVAAVVVALGAHFYGAWRLANQESRSQAAYAAGIALLLRRILQEAEANCRMFIDSRDEASLGNEKFMITRPLSGVQAITLPFLNHEEALLLLKSANKTLAMRIDKLISDINLNNLGIEEYASRRKDFIPLSDTLVDYISSCKPGEPDNTSPLVVKCKTRLEDLSYSVKEMTARTKGDLVSAKSVVDDFNRLCVGKTPFADLQISYDDSIAKLTG